MQATLMNPERLDLVSFDPTVGEYALIISALDAWDDSEEEQVLLLRKINNYLNFVTDGGFSEHFPDSRGRSTRIQIDSAAVLPPNAERIVTQAQVLLQPHGLRLCVNLIGQ